MKIERLSDNQIRCILTKEDLSERGLRLSELALGSDKAREFFREMMDQARFLYGFQAEDAPLMIEAVPTDSGTLVLLVTRVDSPEALEQTLTGVPAEANEDPTPGLRPQDIKAYQAFLLTHRLYTFPSISAAAEAARHVAPRYTGESALYEDPEEHIYYLFLTMQGAEEVEAMQSCLAALTEYGSRALAPYARMEHLREHGRTILAEDALAALSTL